MTPDELEEKLRRPAIGPTLGCCLYVGTLIILVALVLVAVWAMLRSV